MGIEALRHANMPCSSNLVSVEVLGPLSGQNGEMVRLEGETSNALFETLADWDEQLKHCFDDDFPDDPELDDGDDRDDLDAPAPRSASGRGRTP